MDEWWSLVVSKLDKLASKYPKTWDSDYSYGTAGFRMRADLLNTVVFRVGLVASLRSNYLNGKTIGVMITASHNPVQDNGVKIVDPLGEMLESKWEEIAVEIVNSNNLTQTFLDVTNRLNIGHDTLSNVLIARDTRPSGEELANAAIEGASAIKCQVSNFGLLTTPQCHYLVRSLNTLPPYGDPSENGYFTKFSTAYVNLFEMSGKKPSSLVVDAANGVGGAKMKEMINCIGSSINATVINDGDGVLNHLCGSDHVKVTQSPPCSVTAVNGVRFASLDGDADRLVYFYFQDSKFHLLDGDRIAALSAYFFGKHLSILGLNLKIGVVQTAYANGNSTKFLKSLNIPVACVETGVKHLHHKAEEYDIGIYFEANGHGTILFKESVNVLLKSVSQDNLTEKQKQSLKKILLSIELINQSVGDAISILLFVECVLAIENLSMEQWESQYKDLPNKQLKCKVKDRSAFKTTNADTELVSPASLQTKINEYVKKVKNGRSFVRPSGTEDVVRIYAEAETSEEVDTLANNILKELQMYC